MDSPNKVESPDPSSPERRCFLTKALAAGIGGVVTVIPAAAGLGVLLDPLRRANANGANLIRITTLEALPEDGTPVKFAVVADKTDAWTRHPQAPVGAVYLRRTGPKTIQALNVVCPHAGCFVDYSPDRGEFLCPCHNSSFKLDGTIDNPDSPSPRPLDSLEVAIRNDKEVWVKFQNFRAGVHEKIPEA